MTLSDDSAHGVWAFPQLVCGEEEAGAHGVLFELIQQLGGGQADKAEIDYAV